jgi:Na+-transporting NADH:ubiquinone oxidoreductase subunit NqrF
MPKNHPAVEDNAGQGNLPPGDPSVHVEQAKPGDPTTVPGPTGPQAPDEPKLDPPRPHRRGR